MKKLIVALLLALAVTVTAPSSVVAGKKKPESTPAKDTMIQVELLGGEDDVSKSMQEAAKILWLLEESK